MIDKAHWSLPLLFLAACSSQPEKAEQAATKPVPTLHEMMTQRIDPDADAIWAIGNGAIDEKASLDPSKMTDKSWADLEAASRRMNGHATELAALDPVVVTRPGVPVADEGTPGAPSPAQIQGHIARDHELYRSLAQALAAHGNQLADAARSKDAVTAGRLLNEMDGVCESCHLEFWYPEQKAFVLAHTAGNATAP